MNKLKGNVRGRYGGEINTTSPISLRAFAITAVLVMVVVLAVDLLPANLHVIKGAVIGFSIGLAYRYGSREQKW